MFDTSGSFWAFTPSGYAECRNLASHQNPIGSLYFYYMSNSKHLTRAGLAGHFAISLPTVDSWVRRGCPVIEKGGKGKEYVFGLTSVEAWHETEAYEREAKAEYEAEYPPTKDGDARLCADIHRWTPYIDWVRLVKDCERNRHYTVIKRFHEEGVYEGPPGPIRPAKS